MTGDGVNDALALKDADIGVAMGNGAQATKAVAELVLLDGRFSHLPDVLAEGRRVIGNVERVANLFVAKNAMSLIAILAAAITAVPFPFLPRHLTLVSAVTIGIPAFFLALGPNKRRYLPGFLGRILRFAVPSGAVAGLGGHRVLPARRQRLRRAARRVRRPGAPSRREPGPSPTSPAGSPAAAPRSRCSPSSSGSSSCSPGRSGPGRRLSSPRWWGSRCWPSSCPFAAQLLQPRRAACRWCGSRWRSVPSVPALVEAIYRLSPSVRAGAPRPRLSARRSWSASPRRGRVHWRRTGIRRDLMGG